MLIDGKICTMNCGPAAGDTRTETQRRAECDDCIAAAPTPPAQASGQAPAEELATLRMMRADYSPVNGPMSTLKATALDAAIAALSRYGQAPAASAEPPVGDKGHPRFIAGYDAGMADARRMAASAEPVAWFVDWPDEPELGHYLAEAPADVDSGRSRALGFLDAAPVAAQAPAPPALADWRIDTTAGGPILVYKNCSVIEGEQAEYVLRLIAAAQAPKNDAITPQFASDVLRLMHLATIGGPRAPNDNGEYHRLVEAIRAKLEPHKRFVARINSEVQ